MNQKSLVTAGPCTFPCSHCHPTAINCNHLQSPAIACNRPYLVVWVVGEVERCGHRAAVRPLRGDGALALAVVAAVGVAGPALRVEVRRVARMEDLATALGKKVLR